MIGSWYFPRQVLGAPEEKLGSAALSDKPGYSDGIHRHIGYNFGGLPAAAVDQDGIDRGAGRKWLRLLRLVLPGYAAYIDCK
jgi:hypothetical protein